jgi:hypothetical protein
MDTQSSMTNTYCNLIFVLLELLFLHLFTRWAIFIISSFKFTWDPSCLSELDEFNERSFSVYQVPLTALILSFISNKDDNITTRSRKLLQ